MKRGNDRGHLSKDEYDRATEEEEDMGSGTYRKADER
jgi:hypothetical protein